METIRIFLHSGIDEHDKEKEEMAPIVLPIFTMFHMNSNENFILPVLHFGCYFATTLVKSFIISRTSLKTPDSSAPMTFIL